MKLGRLRALVVDDDRQTTEMIRSILMGIGARSIEPANSAASAKARLAEQAFDVIIVSQDLGGDDQAFDFVRKLRFGDLNAPRTMPIVMVAADPDRSQIIRARDAGVNEIVSKPFSSGGFLARLEKAVDTPRPFVESHAYVGPDRRRRTSAVFAGTDRRKAAAPAAPRPAPAETARAAAPKLDPRSVLIIGDDPINRMVIRSTVEQLGCEARLARDGASALRCLETDRFDVVLTDIHMADMDGRQVVERLRRADGPNREVPVVAITRDATLSQRDLARLGFDALMPRPFSIPMMREALMARRAAALPG